MGRRSFCSINNTIFLNFSLYICSITRTTHALCKKIICNLESSQFGVLPLEQQGGQLGLRLVYLFELIRDAGNCYPSFHETDETDLNQVKAPENTTRCCSHSCMNVSPNWTPALSWVSFPLHLQYMMQKLGPSWANKKCGGHA